jgi:hypothetical protein
MAFSLTLHNQAMAQYGAGSVSGAGGGGGGGRQVPLGITAGVNLGFDNNVLGSNANTAANGRGSLSVGENLVLTYDRPTEPGEPTEVHLIGVADFTQYPDVGTDDKDLNLTLGLTHYFSTRLSFFADVFAAYQTEPNFQSNVGPTNVRAPHFNTNNTFSLSYHWLPRLSSITSFTFDRIQYEQTTTTTTAVGIAQNRSQYTFAEGLQFSLTTRTNLNLQYRYLIVDYDSAPRDSTTHFALAGFDHNLTENLSIDVLGGTSFRSFKDDGSSIDPYASVNVSYRGSNHSLSWLTTYGVEQATNSLARGSVTFRTGLNASYRLTSRINARAAVYYYNSNNQGSSGTTSASTTSAGAQDGLQFTLGLNYWINQHWAVNANTVYSAQFSSGGQGGQGGQGNYSRNHYFAGLTYTY